MLAISASLIPVKYVVTNMHTPRLVLHLEREERERREEKYEMLCCVREREGDVICRERYRYYIRYSVPI